tara:strand:- start:12127 stop:13323 length:1197 start_codon:yes stop_codon:yes gene_type:complete
MRKNQNIIINDIKVFTFQAGWNEWSFIKIETNTEIFGWAECTDTFKNLNGFCGILKDFKNIILYEEALNIKRIIWKLKTKSKSNPGSLIQRVISAIENALWDILGKKKQVPVHKLIGKEYRKEIELYWSHCGTTRVRTPQFLDKPAIKSLRDVKPFCEEINKTDFKVIKTNLATFSNGPKIYMPGHNITFNNPSLKLKKETLVEIIDWIKELNTHLNNDIYIAVDLNFNFETKDLIKIAESLKKFRIKWLEIDSYSAQPLLLLKKKTKIPIVTGETIMELSNLEKFIDKKCSNFISVDLIWSGLTESKKIADFCKKKKINITTHNYNGYLGTFMSANLAASVSNFFIGEIDIDEIQNLDKIFSNSPNINGRFLNVPDRPGWGCELNEKQIKKVFSAKN